MGDTFAVMARFPMDDILVEVFDTQEEADRAAKSIIDNPELLTTDWFTSFSVIFRDLDFAPDIADLGTVAVLRLLNGKTPLELVSKRPA